MAVPGLDLATNEQPSLKGKPDLEVLQLGTLPSLPHTLSAVS